MLRETAIPNIYVICGYTDMRKGQAGLIQIIQGTYALDPYSESLFLFCGRNARKIKGLCWEGDGFLLLSKALNCKDCRFQWPRTAEEARLLTKDPRSLLSCHLKVNVFCQLKSKSIRHLTAPYSRCVIVIRNFSL